MHARIATTVSILFILATLSRAQNVPVPAGTATAPPDTAAADTVPAPPKLVRTLKLEPFAIDSVDVKMFTGTLEVPENYDQPRGRKISLHVVLIPAAKAEPDAAPLFDIAGGPGAAATDGAGEYATILKRHREWRDVVLVDQRGTGRSNPLRCAELEGAGRLADLYDRAAVRRCRDELAKNADLAQYTTLNAARDLDAVRHALAYEQIDLAGLSYGTQVVQTYMREFPDRVRSAVMLGTVPLGEKIPLHHARNANDVLEDLLDDCDADPDCGHAYPSLRRDWTDLREAFASGRVSAEYTDSTGTREVILHSGPFFETLRTFLMATSTQRRVPHMIHHAAAGNFKPFLDAAFGAGMGGFAEGMYLCVTCPEGTMRIAADEVDRETAGAFGGRWRVDQQIGACEEWGVPALPEEAFVPVTSVVPTLLLAGEMDYVTPFAWAAEVSSRLTNSLVVVIDHLGHFPDGLTNMECYDAVIDDFFRRGSIVGLDTSCLETMMPPEFLIDE